MIPLRAQPDGLHPIPWAGGKPLRFTYASTD
jgi:hypothetical protein